MAENIKSSIFFGKEYRVFLVSISLIVAIFVAGIFLGLYYRNGQLIKEEIVTNARSDFNDIALNRNWGAGHSGVYAEKKRVVDPNIYLNNPDFESMNGKFYTKVGSTLMTAEISTLASMEGMLLFHVTSLSPFDPKNLADEFEMEALKQFDYGVHEVFRNDDINGKAFFRYMSPLYVKQECLECHFRQGYRLGDIRGGISLNYNIDHIQAKLKKNNIIIFSLGVLTIILLLTIIYLIALKLMKKLSLAYKRIEELSVTDELTGLYNRRFLNERLRAESRRASRHKHLLSFMMIDIDFFKKFNDTYGHPTGDILLKEISAVISGNCRTEDLAARYGGEEFAVVVPETTQEDAFILAERIRKLVEELNIVNSKGVPLMVTISIGVSNLGPDELEKSDTGELLIEYADRALYMAKANGRNRVEVFKKLDK